MWNFVLCVLLLKFAVSLLNKQKCTANFLWALSPASLTWFPFISYFKIISNVQIKIKYKKYLFLFLLATKRLLTDLRQIFYLLNLHFVHFLFAHKAYENNTREEDEKTNRGVIKFFCQRWVNLIFRWAPRFKLEKKDNY